MFNRLARLLAVGLELTGTAWAQTPKDDRFIRELRAKATAGDADAQVNLGNAYADGRGVPQDDAQAVAWWRKAADQGNAVAQGNLGWMYANGWGVTQDDAQAVAWYRKAAEQGDPYAQCNLGVMVAWYRSGQGTQPEQIGRASCRERV